MQRVELEPLPLATTLHDAALLRGPAARDVLRVLVEGIKTVQWRDGIAPSPLLLQSVAALQAAANVRADIADVRESPTPATSKQSGQFIEVKEAARMLALTERQTRRLMPVMGGTRTSKGWRVPVGEVAAFIEERRTA